LRCIVSHDLLCKTQRILPLWRRHLCLVFLQRWRVGFRSAGEQIHYGAFACCALVDGEACAEFAVAANLNRFEELDGEVLAVVAYEVVGGPGRAPSVGCVSAGDEGIL
jgi:hypothetical protein